MPAILCAQLRRLRVESHVTQEQAARALAADTSKISRLESGRTKWHERDLRELLSLYGVDESEHAKYLEWTARVNQSWWPAQSSAAQSTLDDMLDCASVSLIRSYEPAVVPALLQTPDYTRALLEMASEPLSPAAIDKVIDLQHRRRMTLSHTRTTTAWLIVEEAALRRPILHDTAWRAQLDLLGEFAERPRINVQVLDERACGPAVIDHAFTLLRFAAPPPGEPHLSDLVVVRQLNGSTCLDTPDDTDRYRQAADRLAVLAPPPNRTTELLGRIRQAVLEPKPLRG